MNNQFQSSEEQTVVEAEQLKAFFRETNDQNIAGALVMTLLVWVVYEGTRVLSWLPAMLGLYLLTAYRFWMIRKYHRQPAAHPAAYWRRNQIICGGISGICWGVTNTVLLTQVAIEYQLLILTVLTVSAATNASEGFAFPGPSRAFILLALLPPTAWLFTVSDEIHYILAVMLCVFMPMTLWQGEKRSRVFIEAQQLRFRNEVLAGELARQCEVTEQASRSKGRFLAAASHDLRQPMQALTIFHELLERELAAAGTVSANLVNAQKAAKSVRSLLDALLDISKLEADVIRPDTRAFPLQRLLDELARDFLPLAAQKGLQLRIRPCAANVVSDSMLLSRVMLNLVSNALRYTPHGKVLVAARRRGAMLELMVADTGIGIAPEHQQEVFSEFYQVGNHARDRQHGIGLGLAIVDRIARLLGHPLALKSRPGHGSCFSIRLPLAADQGQLPIADTLPAEDGEPPALPGRTLLLVEDEADIRAGMTTLLGEWGYGVIAAGSAEEALERLKAAPGGIDGVLTDMGLPGTMSGIDLVASLRQTVASDLPALLVTGDTGEATLQAARAAHLFVLHKPVRPARLRLAISTVLQKRGSAPAEEGPA